MKVRSSMGEVKNIEMRPEVRGSGDPSDLPPYVIFRRGTPEAQARLSSPNEDTLYFVSQEGATSGKLYLGDKLISSDASAIVDTALSPTSKNPVENRAIYQAVNSKAEILSNTVDGWNQQPQLVAEKNKLYVYTDYKLIDGNPVPGFKVGDGTSQLIDMPFSNEPFFEHMANTYIHVTDEEKNFWNNKVRCYIDPQNSEGIIFTIN